jgi:hypothetical protein
VTSSPTPGVEALTRGAGFIPQDRPLAPAVWESSAVRNFGRSCGLKSALLRGAWSQCMRKSERSLTMNPSPEEVLLAAALAEIRHANRGCREGKRSGTFLIDRASVFTKSPASSFFSLLSSENPPVGVEGRRVGFHPRPSRSSRETTRPAQ